MTEYIRKNTRVRAHRWDGDVEAMEKFMASNDDDFVLTVVPGDIIHVRHRFHEYGSIVKYGDWVVFASLYDDPIVYHSLQFHELFEVYVPPTACTQEHYPYSPWENEWALNV